MIRCYPDDGVDHNTLVIHGADATATGEYAADACSKLLGSKCSHTDVCLCVCAVFVVSQPLPLAVISIERRRITSPADTMAYIFHTVNTVVHALRMCTLYAYTCEVLLSIA